MKRRALYSSILILFLVGFVVTALACAPKAEAPKPEVANKPILVGWAPPITGTYGPMGARELMRIEPLIAYVNQQGGVAGHPMKWALYDSETDPTKAVILTKKMITQDNVHMIFGPGPTGLDMAIGPVCGENKVVHISGCGNTMYLDSMKKAGEQIFKYNFTNMVTNPDEDYGATVKAMKVLGFTKVAIMYPESAYGKQNREGFKAYAAANNVGLDIVVDMSFAADATTFGPQIAALKGHPEVQVVYANGVEMATCLFIVAMREAGIQLPVFMYSIGISSTPDILKIEKIRSALSTDPAAYVICFATDCWRTLDDRDPRKALYQKWDALSEAQTGETMTGYADFSPYILMAQAQDVWGRLLKDKPNILDEDLGTIRSAVRDYVESTKDFYGVSGITYTPENHGGQMPGTGRIIGRFIYPPPFTYVPGSESKTPPWIK